MRTPATVRSCSFYPAKGCPLNARPAALVYRRAASPISRTLYGVPHYRNVALFLQLTAGRTHPDSNGTFVISPLVLFLAPFPLQSRIYQRDVVTATSTLMYSTPVDHNQARSVI